MIHDAMLGLRMEFRRCRMDAELRGGISLLIRTINVTLCWTPESLPE